MHLNVQSATNKKIDIEQAAHTELLDIILLNETFLKPKTNFKLKGYTIWRNDRSRAERGGICICVRETIPSMVISKSPSDSITEWITVRLPKILPSGEDLFIASVYIPPTKEIPDEDMKTIFNNVNTIAAGDLNAHNTLWGSKVTEKCGASLQSIAESQKLTIHHTDTPTYAPYHNLNCASTIDLVITSDKSEIQLNKPFTLASPRSDHLPVLFTIESKPIDRKQQTTTTKSRTDWDKFKQEAKNTLQPLVDKQINTKEDIDKMAESLKTSITEAINKSTTTVNVKIYQTQILPRKIVTMIKDRRRLQRNLLQTTTAQVQQLIDQAIETKIKPFLETLINLTTTLTLLLSHREVFSLPNVVKINTASNHISNTTNYKVNQEAILQSVRSLIYETVQAAEQATAQSQLPQQPTQQQQQSKRKSRSPSISSSYDPSIHDLNNTNMDAETSILQTPNYNKVTSSITVAKPTNNNVSSKPHNSSRQPHQKKPSTSTLHKSTISQRNKETIQTNNA